mgnify:CR=1 FL=1
MRKKLIYSLVGILVVAFGGLFATLIGGEAPSLGLDLQGGISITQQPVGEFNTASLDLAEEVRFKAGDTIFSKGDSGESLYVIVQGEVNVHDGGLDLKRLKDKSVFGELAVLDPEPRSASVTAITDTHLLRLDSEAFLELMSGNMEVVRGVLSVLCDRIREKLIEARPTPPTAAKA